MPGQDKDLEQALTAGLDPYFAGCHFTPSELELGRRALERVEQEDLIRSVASPPDQWGITIEEQIALAEYLAKRKQELLIGDLRDTRQLSVDEGG